MYKSAIHTIQYIWATFVSCILLGQGILPIPLGTQCFGRLRSPWELSQGLIFLRVQQDEAVCCQRRHQQKGCLSSGACHDCGLSIHSWSHIPLAQALSQHLTLKLTWYLIISKPGGWGHDRSRFLSSAFSHQLAMLIFWLQWLKICLKSALREWCDQWGRAIQKRGDEQSLSRQRLSHCSLMPWRFK